MEQNKERLFTVGELARRGGITVRTLQYYDAQGLLKPSEYSEGGRRLYSKRDVLRLHRILFLKSLGFSLEEIRDRLLSGSSTELRTIFDQQKRVLVQQIDHLREVVELLSQTIEELDAGNEVETPRLFAIIGSMQADNPYSFMVRHLSREQIEDLVVNVENEANADRLNKQVNNLTAELIELHRQKADPTGSAGQDLAKQWWEVMQEISGHDPAMLQGIFQLGADLENWPVEGATEIQEAMTEFLGPALGAYMQAHNIRSPFGEER